MGIVVATNTGSDGFVRSANVQYFVRRGVADVWKPEEVSRSVQRLVLILPVEEQNEALAVREEEAEVLLCKAS